MILRRERNETGVAAMTADDRDAASAVPKADADRGNTAEMPPAGPHARPDLIDPDKTPSTGMLPSDDDTNPSPTG